VKIFFDTSHLIRVFEKSDPVSAATLEAVLRDGGHELVLSLATINELAAPLHHSRASTNVMGLLNALEALPLTYVADVRIDRLELEAAIGAWRHSLEPASVDPFTDRLDRVLALDGSMFAFWQLGLIGGPQDFLPRFRSAVQAHREAGLPDRTQHLIATIDRYLDLYGIPFPRVDLPDFGYWVAADWRRAPATHLQNELFRQLVANERDSMQTSDLGDLIHTGSLPYVDLITLDRRMAHYAAQAAKAIGSNLSARICSNPQIVLQRLRGAA
jgi:predicted nucleic acid-binding protein